MDSLLDSAKSWTDTLGDLAGKYLDYRRVQSQDATDAEIRRYEAEAAAAKASGGSSMPSWLMPAAIIGGVVLVAVMVLKK